MFEETFVVGGGTATVARPRSIAREVLGSSLLRRDGVALLVSLDAPHAWSFDVRRGSLAIVLLEGEVMVTFEGDPLDHVLAPGERFATRGRGRVAVSALRRSLFSVTPR